MSKKWFAFFLKDRPTLLLNDSSFLFCKNDTRIYAKLGFFKSHPKRVTLIQL